MKRLLSFTLAAVLALSFGTSAFAKQGGVVVSNKGGNNSIKLDNGAKTLATLYFKGDTSGDKFYFGVVTDWEESPYESAFADQDAYLFDFQLDGGIPATTVPSLYLYNPYVDDDGEPTIKPSSVVIYKVTKNGLSNVTKDFTSLSTEDDHLAFGIRTRIPGTYILAEEKVDIDAANKSADTGSVSKNTLPVTKTAPQKTLTMPSRAAK